MINGPLLNFQDKTVEYVLDFALVESNSELYKEPGQQRFNQF